MLVKLKWDAYSQYKELGATLVGREWLLPPALKWQNLQPIIEALHKHNMTYGAADYGLHHLGDTACCCGIDECDGFANWFQGNIPTIIRNACQNRIYLPSRSSAMFPKGSARRIMNSQCRLGGTSQSIYRYVRDKWNRPGTINAPDSYLNVRWDGERDINGNCIYVRTSR